MILDEFTGRNCKRTEYIDARGRHWIVRTTRSSLNASSTDTRRRCYFTSSTATSHIAAPPAQRKNGRTSSMTDS